MECIFCSLDSSIQKDAFDCGILELNEYLKQYASQNDKKGIAKTFVALNNIESKVVLGYYCVSMAEIERELLPESCRKGLPRYPVPAMRIGKLAVDQSVQGKGLGEELLVDALRRAVRLSIDVGLFAVIVDALNDRAKSFYLKYGFIPFQENELSLFLPMQTILKTFH